MMNTKPKRLSFRSHGLLMELTIICGFFIAAASIFILVFVRAGALSSRSRDLSAAVNAAQTIVESVVPAEDAPDGERSYTICYDENWGRLDAESDPAASHAFAQVTETWEDGLVHIQVTVSSSSQAEGELYRLSADRDFS